MSAPRGSGPRFSLARWSRRKLQAAAATPAPAPAAPAAAAPAMTAAAPAAVELPPVESLTLASDFTAFLRPEVDERLRRAALKQLFRDPRFNIMDGLDTYIDDYTRADPIAPDVLADLLQRGFGASADAGEQAAAGASALAEGAAASPEVAQPAPQEASPAHPAHGAASTDQRAPAAQDVGAAGAETNSLKPVKRAT